MSEIKVNKISPRSGTTLTLGDSGDDFVIPAGATLTNNGTTSGFASIAWQSTIVTTSTLTAVAGKGYWIDTTSNACTVTLPASASAGDQIIFTDYARNWGTNSVTINTNSLNFQGNTSPNPVYDTNGESVHIVYSGATNGWIPVDDGAVALETPQSYDIDFLVIAGGGGSGDSYSGGGGGAGGYRTSTQTVGFGTVITVTVGDGGAGSNNGSNSSISGTGLTTITSAGGGKGGTDDSSAGSSGGSGGGATGGNFGATAGGAGNTPSTSPSQGNNGGATSTSAPNYGAGGGGGASAVGVNGTNTTGGNGGAGTASSITGSSVTRAGGGGGASYGGGTAGTGGAGGGGDGGILAEPYTSVGTDGTVNTGGGAGGSISDGSSVRIPRTGGKGVVILSMPDASYSGTTTGSPTVATGVSGKTILTFTGSGSYTG
jgi:hypothetical protein